jgi:hypothetical protein
MKAVENEVDGEKMQAESLKFQCCLPKKLEIFKIFEMST